MPYKMLSNKYTTYSTTYYALHTMYYEMDCLCPLMPASATQSGSRSCSPPPDVQGNPKGVSARGAAQNTLLANNLFLTTYICSEYISRSEYNVSRSEHIS